MPDSQAVSQRSFGRLQIDIDVCLAVRLPFLPHRHDGPEGILPFGFGAMKDVKVEVTPIDLKAALPVSDLVAVVSFEFVPIKVFAADGEFHYVLTTDLLPFSDADSVGVVGSRGCCWRTSFRCGRRLNFLGLFGRKVVVFENVKWAGHCFPPMGAVV